MTTSRTIGPVSRRTAITGFGAIGNWQPTGQRTAELVTVYQKLVPRDRSVTDYVQGGIAFEPVQEVWRLSITVDGSGNTLTAVGGSMAYDGDGLLLGDGHYDGGATRMVIVSATSPT